MNDIQRIIDRVHAEVSQPPIIGTLYSPDVLAADIDINWFTIAVVLVDGTHFVAGDEKRQFPLQSISKVFTYGAALEDHGRERLLDHIGVEPTGRGYSALLVNERTGRPYNPMVNAGAIAVADLLKGQNLTHKLNRIVHVISDYVGRSLHVDAATFTYELQTDHRNRAIAYLMKAAGVMQGSIGDALHLYYQQCSLMVNTVELATMAATLANYGTHPHTGKQVIQKPYVRDLLSVMYTCGMYDSSGLWAYRVGLPAKSGVSGGIMAVVPGEMGIAVFSPPLNEIGHSQRGVAAFERLSDQMRLHTFNLSETVARPQIEKPANNAPPPKHDPSTA